MPSSCSVLEHTSEHPRHRGSGRLDADATILVAIRQQWLQLVAMRAELIRRIIGSQAGCRSDKQTQRRRPQQQQLQLQQRLRQQQLVPPPPAPQSTP